jgi:DNA polymerase zeta
VQCISLCIADDGAPDGALIELALVVDARSAADDDDDALLPPPRHCVPGAVAVHSVRDEASLLDAFLSAVQSYDPDILLGFDVHAGSVGFLTERCTILGEPHANLLRALSRTPGHEPPGALRDDSYGRDHGAGIWVTGRAVLNLWRILRGEIKLPSYSYEAAMMAVLRRRVPALPRRTLGAWFAVPSQRWRVIADLAARARGAARMCAQLDLVGRTAELARVFGIDFNSVLIRGSQYRVESMMLRLAHAQNFLALSPDKKALAGNEAPAFIALVMEPESAFYTSPVVVLDFQSLYPSQVIACVMHYLAMLMADDVA